MDVLVTGADQRQGLAVIRALGRKGLEIFATGQERNSVGFFSRYTKELCQYPSPFADKNGFVDTILQVVKKHRIPVVFPTVESTVIALDEFREEFEGLTRLAIAPREPLHIALDKKQTLTLAKELGVPIPRTCFANSLEEALAFAEGIGYPVVMKPRAHPCFDRVIERFEFKVTYAKDREDLIKRLQPFAQKGIYPVLQEYCPGVKVQLGVLFVEDELLGLYQYKGVREYPLTGGVTCLHLTVPVDPDLLGWSLRLLRAMKWEGLAGVEYRVDERTGKKVLMEVNGRLLSTIAGATMLGLNFPYAFYRYVRDGVKEKIPANYPLGKRNRYLAGDLWALMKHWQGDNPDYLDALPRKAKALWNFLRDFGPGVQSEMLDLQDPYPAVVELFSLTREYFRLICRFSFRNIFRPASYRLMRFKPSSDSRGVK